MCYVPPSIELLGPIRPLSFQTRIHDPQISNQTDAPDGAWETVGWNGSD